MLIQPALPASLAMTQFLFFRGCRKRVFYWTIRVNFTGRVRIAGRKYRHACASGWWYTLLTNVGRKCVYTHSNCHVSDTRDDALSTDAEKLDASKRPWERLNRDVLCVIPFVSSRCLVHTFLPRRLECLVERW